MIVKGKKKRNLVIEKNEFSNWKSEKCGWQIESRFLRARHGKWNLNLSGCKREKNEIGNWKMENIVGI